MCVVRQIDAKYCICVCETVFVVVALRHTDCCFPSCLYKLVISSSVSWFLLSEVVTWWKRGVRSHVGCWWLFVFCHVMFNLCKCCIIHELFMLGLHYCRLLCTPLPVLTTMHSWVAEMCAVKQWCKLWLCSFTFVFFRHRGDEQFCHFTKADLHLSLKANKRNAEGIEIYVRYTCYYYYC